MAHTKDEIGLSYSIDALLAEVSAYLVAKYDLAPRDAVGPVIQSPVAEQLREENSSLLNFSVEQLAAQMI